MKDNLKKIRLSLSVKEIVELFKRKMQCGQLKYGDKFPSIPELQSKYKLRRIKIAEIRKILEDEGYIETQSGITGTSVIYLPPGTSVDGGDNFEKER